MSESQTLGTYLDRCVEHAKTVLVPVDPAVPVTDDQIHVYLFQQTWPNTACGWPGVAGQAFTRAYTVVVVGPSGDAAAYLGRPAYYLPHDDASWSERERFYEALYARRMPAVRDCASVGCRRFT